jgi:phage-related protein
MPQLIASGRLLPSTLVPHHSRFPGQKVFHLSPHQFWYTSGSGGDRRDGREPILRVVFYCTDAGSEPVREWLRSLGPADRKAIGADIKTAQYGWPLGMPLIRRLVRGLWEVRSHVTRGIARVIFTVDGEAMVLLHGFVKKSKKTPAIDLLTARRRLARLREE